MHYGDDISNDKSIKNEMTSENGTSEKKTVANFNASGTTPNAAAISKNQSSVNQHRSHNNKMKSLIPNNSSDRTDGGEPMISPRIIQCLTCSKLWCPTHFRTHIHPVGLEIHYLLYHCNVCGEYFANLTSQGGNERQSVSMLNGQQQHVENHLHEDHHDYSVRRHPLRRRDGARLHNPPNNTFEFRGMINMGNTCFMNSVLQALVHNPMLRNFMLTYAVPLLQDQPLRCENFMRLSEKEREDLTLHQLHLHSINVNTTNDDHQPSSFTRKRTRSATIANIPASPQQTPRSFKEIPAIGTIGQTPQRKRRRIMRKSQKQNATQSVEDESSVDGFTFSSPDADHRDVKENTTSIDAYSALEASSDRHTTLFPVTLPSREFSKDFIKKHISIGTELQNLVHESYCAKRGPIIPNDFLYVVWKSAGHLAGYRQQDAHELLMAVLNGLSSSPPFSNVADFIFRGKLESRLDCRRCQYSSSTTDPFLDISLHLKAHNTDSSGKEKPFSNLYECLQRYTRQELLDNEYKCPACQSQGSCTKRLSFKRLPIVSCLHLKRFETHHLYNTQSSSRRRGGNGPTKIDDYIDFPLELDLFPFTSNHIHDNMEQSELNTEYELFAVVEHFGGMNSGHYICYVKREDQWHLCDDETVRLSTETQVEKCRAYILFYIQKELQFEDC